MAIYIWREREKQYLNGNDIKILQYDLVFLSPLLILVVMTKQLFLWRTTKDRLPKSELHYGVFRSRTRLSLCLGGIDNQVGRRQISGELISVVSCAVKFYHPRELKDTEYGRSRCEQMNVSGECSVHTQRSSLWGMKWCLFFFEKTDGTGAHVK